MGLKIIGAGGIDQKSNNLLRDDLNLISSENVMLNTFGEYVKRPGTEVDAALIGTSNDMIYIKSLNEYFYRDGADYKSIKDGVTKTIYQFADPSSAPTSDISLAEYLNTAMFTHIEGQNFTAKYDGGSIYRAGLPAPEITVTSGAGTGLFMLTYFEYVDTQGIQCNGPATITEIGVAGNFTYNTLKDSGFYAGYIYANAGFPGFTISASNRTITYTSISSDLDYTNDFCVGSSVVFRACNVAPILITIGDTAGNSLVFSDVLLEIESITSTQITFTAESFGTKTIEFYNPAGVPVNILGSCRLRVFYSTNPATGFNGDIAYARELVNNSLATQNFTPPLVANEKTLLSDIYDITTSKLRPPKCKYVQIYGYQLVCGNVISFYDFNNRETTYTNNDLVMYSDLSTGDLGENFSESNRQLIGNTYDGQISGLGRVKDSLIVFKDKMVFSMDGALVPGQYTLRKIETNEIGCTSFKSIVSIDDGLLFQGQDGIYITDGFRITGFSDSLDVFFTQIDNKLTRSVVNNSLDQYLFWTDQGIAVFDYTFKKWFVWKNINASSGITVDNDGSIRFFNSTNAIKFKVALNDIGVAINAFIRSSWFTMNEPGLLKKATFLRLYSFNNAGQSVSLKYFMDWSEAKVKGPFIIDMTDTTTKTIKRNLDIIMSQSFSFEFRNNTLNEDLNISGYEINAGVIQTRDKNAE